MDEVSDALSEEKGGTVIAIEVTTGAKNAQFPYGYNVWRKSIGCRVTAPAIEGRANKAIIGVIAGSLHVPASAVSIVSGATSSQKRILVTGTSKDEILRLLLPLFR